MRLVHPDRIDDQYGKSRALASPGAMTSGSVVVSDGRVDSGEAADYGEAGRRRADPIRRPNHSAMVPMNDTPSSAPWGDHDVPDQGETLEFSFGPLEVRIRRVKNELWVAHLREGDVPTSGYEAEAALDHTDWSRWALRDETARLRLIPALPDRMLVVKVEQPFTLLRRAQARIYTRVGASVRIQAVGDSGADDLVEIPVERLSDTWRGDFRSGETAYWLATRARREVPGKHLEPWQIVCTLQLTNTSSDALPVEKLALRVEHLSVFESGDRLWAEEVGVVYRGEDEGSDIEMTGRAPAEAEGATEVAPARVRSGGFRARTFAKLKALTPFTVGG